MLHDISYTISKLTSMITTKIIALFALLSWELFFGDIPKQAIAGVIILIVFDFVTAIIAVKKNGEEIKSRKIGRTMTKIVLYVLGISACYLTEQTVGFDFGATEIIMAFIGLTELFSILENTSKAGFAIPKKLFTIINTIKDEKTGDSTTTTITSNTPIATATIEQTTETTEII